MPELCVHCVALRAPATPATRKVVAGAMNGGDLLLCHKHWHAQVVVAQANANQAHQRLELVLNAARIATGEVVRG
jgi:hypothetical protein